MNAPIPAQQQLDPLRVQSIINTLATQRNQAQDQIVNLQADIALMQARIEMLEAVNKKLMGMVPPKEPAPPPPPEVPELGAPVEG